MRGIGLRLCDELIRRGSVFDTPLIARLRSRWLGEPAGRSRIASASPVRSLCSALEMVPHANILLERVERAGIMLNRPIQQFLCLRLFGERLQLLQINVRERRVGRLPRGDLAGAGTWILEWASRNPKRKR